MTFSDIFKSSFLENVTSVSPIDMVLALALAFGLGLFIFFIYKKTFSGVMYSGNFGVTLIALTMITTLVILAVTSNVVLSLGMVGALSIVRFRTAIKEPLDIAFLFWAIAAGIVLAAGLIPLAVFGSVVIGITLLLFANRRSSAPLYHRRYLPERGRRKAGGSHACRFCKKLSLKSKSVRAGQIELNYELRLKGDKTGFVSGMSELPGVGSAVLVSYNGDYLS